MADSNKERQDPPTPKFSSSKDQETTDPNQAKGHQRNQHNARSPPSSKRRLLYTSTRHEKTNERFCSQSETIQTTTELHEILPHVHVLALPEVFPCSDCNGRRKSGQNSNHHITNHATTNGSKQQNTDCDTPRAPRFSWHGHVRYSH